MKTSHTALSGAVGQAAPASQPRKRRKEARPGELMAAALTLFVEKGFAATRLDDVAAQAGVSKGTLYLYFDSKVALLKAVVEENIMPIVNASEEEVARYEGSSEELLRRLLNNWQQQTEGKAIDGLSKLIISEARNFPEVAQFYYDKVLARGRAQLRLLLERAIRRGEFRPLDIEATIDVIIYPLMMSSIWQHSLAYCDGNRRPQNLLPALCDIVLPGLRASDTHGKT